MASNNRRDVQLVISAKEQASKAFEAAASALESLLDVNKRVGASASQTGDRLSDLATMAATLDKAYAAITGSADKAESAFNRQQAAIAENRAALAALKAQAEQTAQALQRIPVAIVDQKLAGSDTTGLVAQFKAAQVESDRLQASIAKLTSTIAVQEQGLDAQRSTLQQIGSTSIAAAEAQERLRAATDQESAAAIKRNAEIAQEIQRRDQAAAAAERMLVVQQRINQITGVDRQSAGSASASAAVLAEVAAHDELIQTLKREEAAQRELNQVREAQARAARLLPGGAITGKSAKDSAAVFQQADIERADQMADTVARSALEVKELDAAALKLRNTLNPLAAVEAELNRELAATNRLYATGRISAVELSKATELLTRNANRASAALAARGKPTLFGLTPYNVQNLGYQINDLITQVASGTSLTQALAQQGGQILQIFPKVGSAIIRAFTNPVVLAFAVTLGTVVLALKRLSNEADQLRTFNAQLAGTAEQGTYTAKSMSDAANSLKSVGTAADDATASITTFRKAGIDPALFVAFGKAAKDASKVIGKDIPDAAKEIADAFSGGYDAVKKLDDQYDFLLASERELIRNMFEQGDAAQARTMAFDIWSSKMKTAAENADGPWSRAWKNLTEAFRNFIDYISKSAPIQFLNDLLNRTGEAAERLTRMLAGRNAAAAAASVADGSNEPGTKDWTASVGNFKKPLADTVAITEASQKIANDMIDALRKQLQITQDLTDAEKVREAGLKAVTKAQSEGVVDPAKIKEIKELAQLDAQRKVDIEKQAKARALEAELANDNLATQKAGAQSLQAILDSIDRKTASTMAKIKQAEVEGVTQVGGQTLAVLREQVAANTEIVKQQALQKFYSDQLSALDQQRADAQRKITDQVKAGTLSPAQGAAQLAELTSRLAPQYQAIADSAQRFKDALGTTKVTPEIQAFLDRVSTGGADAGGANAKASLDLLSAGYSELNAAISERNALVQTNNALQQQGVFTATELEEKNRLAYEGAAPAIQAQIDAMTQLIELLHEQGRVSDQVYAAWQAKLLLIGTQMTFVDKAANQMADAINNSFAQGAASAMDRFAQSVAAGANVFDSAKDAFLQFASDFLRQIAQMIIKQAIFNAIGGGTGGGASGGGLGGIIAGLFHKGGIVGQSGDLRAARPEWFKNAYRYHKGGMAGLAPGEVPAILQRNEEVLTRNDPRHAMNGGAAPAQSPNIRNVIVFDPADVVEKALNTKAGEKTLLTWVRNNSGAMKSALG